MKKRTAFIGAVLSLIPLGQPLFFKSSLVFSSTAFFVSFHEKVNAELIDTYVNRGVKKAEQGDYLGAIDEYNKAIKENQNNSGAYYNRANAKTELKDYTGAIIDYTKVINLNPRWSPLAYSGRANAKSEQGDYKGAINDFNKSIELYSKDAETFYNRGNVKFEIKDYQGAIDDYSKALKINSKSKNEDKFYANRGFVKKEIGDFAGAIDDFNMAISINPKDSNNFINRSVAKYQSGNKKGACNDAMEASLLGFDASNAIEIFCKKDNLKNKISSNNNSLIKEIEKLNKKRNQSLQFIEKGRSEFLDKKNYENAIHQYNKAIKIDPNYYFTYYLRANVKERNGDIDGALSDHRKWFNLDKKNSKLSQKLFKEGLINERSGNCPRAIINFTKSIILDDKNANAYLERGKCYRKVGLYSLAIKDEESITNIIYKPAYRGAGDFFYELGLYEEANIFYVKNLQISKTSKAFLRLANSAIKLGDYKSAKINYTKSIQKDWAYRRYKKDSLGSLRVLEDFQSIEGPYFNRGIANYFLRDYENAINDFQFVLEINSNSVDKLDNWRLSLLPKKYESIIDQKKQSEITCGRYQFGEILNLKNNKNCNNASMSDVQYFLRPDFASSYYYYLASAQRGLKDFRNSMINFDKSLDINPFSVDGYLARGLLKIQLGDYLGSKKDFDKAILIEPENNEAYTNRAKSNYLIGDFYSSCMDSTKAASLGSLESKQILKNEIGKKICDY